MESQDKSHGDGLEVSLCISVDVSRQLLYDPLMRFEPEKLESMRLAAGLTRAKMTARMHQVGSEREASALYRWEKGRTRPNVDDLAHFAMALDVGVESFFSLHSSSDPLDRSTEAA